VIVPGKEQILSGDYDMETPDKPTVQSGGNDPLWISVCFTPMTGETYGKVIEDFDAVFREEKLEFRAGDLVTFSNPLEPCHTEKMDFSVHAPLGTPADVYTGLLYISIGDMPSE